MPRCLLSFVQAQHTRIHEGRLVVPFSRLPLFSSPSHVRQSAPEQTDLVFRSWVVGRRSCCACDARTRRLAERARNVGRQSSWRRCCLGIALRQHSDVSLGRFVAVSGLLAGYAFRPWPLLINRKNLVRLEVPPDLLAQPEAVVPPALAGSCPNRRQIVMLPAYSLD